RIVESGFLAIPLQPTLGTPVVRSHFAGAALGQHLEVVSQDDARLYSMGEEILEIWSLTPAAAATWESPLTPEVAIGQPLPTPFALHFDGGAQDLLRGTPVSFVERGGAGVPADGRAHAVADAAGHVRVAYTAGPIPGVYTIGMAAPVAIPAPHVT